MASRVKYTAPGNDCLFIETVIDATQVNIRKRFRERGYHIISIKYVWPFWYDIKNNRTGEMYESGTVYGLGIGDVADRLVAHRPDLLSEKYSINIFPAREMPQR